METAYTLAFMAFAFGFFLTIFLVITRDHREANDRRLMELREFGYVVTDPESKQDPEPRHRKKSK